MVLDEVKSKVNEARERVRFEQQLFYEQHLKKGVEKAGAAGQSFATGAERVRTGYVHEQPQQPAPRQGRQPKPRRDVGPTVGQGSPHPEIFQTYHPMGPASMPGQTPDFRSAGPDFSRVPNFRRSPFNRR
jgi:hypothetical protein